MQRTVIERPVVAKPALKGSSFIRPCSAQHASKRLRANPEKHSEEFTSMSLEQLGKVGAVGLLGPLLMDVQGAFAQGREFGIIEGRIASLYHPAIMLFLFGASVYGAWLGFQWRSDPKTLWDDPEARTQNQWFEDSLIHPLRRSTYWMLGEKMWSFKYVPCSHVALSSPLGALHALNLSVYINITSPWQHEGWYVFNYCRPPCHRASDMLRLRNLLHSSMSIVYLPEVIFLRSSCPKLHSRIQS